MTVQLALLVIAVSLQSCSDREKLRRERGGGGGSEPCASTLLLRDRVGISTVASIGPFKGRHVCHCHHKHGGFLHQPPLLVTAKGEWLCRIFFCIYLCLCVINTSPTRAHTQSAESINGVSVLSPQWVKLVGKLMHPWKICSLATRSRHLSHPSNESSIINTKLDIWRLRIYK